MWDWSSFVSGVVGAMLGGSITLGVALLSRRDQRRLGLSALVREITGELHALAEARAGEPIVNGAYGPETSNELLKTRRAIAELTMKAGKAGKRAAAWTDRKMFVMLNTEDTMQRVNTFGEVVEELADWVGGRRGSAWFKSEVVAIDENPEHIANRRTASKAQEKP